MNQFINHIPRQASFLLLLLTFFLIQACPEPPETKPQLADCPIGKSPCEDDSTICCWDTTSHNFTWKIDTLGISGSLRDVQIIDENNIWVVGEFETDSVEYNATRWDGIRWNLLQIKPQGFVQSLQTIFIIDDDEIWFGRGSLPIYYDGSTFDMQTPAEDGYPGGFIINDIWGTSANDIYFVGTEGNIVHYDGTVFTKMTSPTTQDLDGIVGVVDSKTGSKRIWVYGWTDYPNRGLLLQSDGTDWEVIWDENNPFFEDEQYVEPILWVNEQYLVAVVAGSNDSQISIHTTSNIQDYKIIHNDTEGWTQTISGINENDLFFAGQFGNIFHFNGSTIKYYSVPEITDNFYFLESDMKNDLVIIVSLSNYILKGYRVN